MADRTVGATKGRAKAQFRGFPPLPLIVAYVGIALAPLGLAYAQGLSPRSFWDELSSGLALVGFSMLLIEFVLSGRFKTVSGGIGIDLTMRFHQLVARTLTVFILVHPFLYTTPIAGRRPWDSGGSLTLGLDAGTLITGLLAWILLIVLVITSIRRDQLPYRYETWRMCHGLGAMLIALFGAHHAIEAGRYSGRSDLEIFWYVMVGLAALTLVYVYVYSPWRQSRAPYRVVSVEKAAQRTWEVVVEPVRSDAMNFEAGQFAWLTLGVSSYSIREHPFSMSSCPADRPRIGFTIKEVGDFTRNIGSIPVGASAYLDGPHGNLTLADRQGEGLAFIAGGVGLAPIMSILRQLRAEGDRRPMVLIYGNRCADQILYGDELTAMQRDLSLQIHHVLSEPEAGWDGAVGRLDQAVLDKLLPSDGRDRRLYFVCGPGPMIDDVERSLGRLGIPTGQIVSEKFSYD